MENSRFKIGIIGGSGYIGFSLTKHLSKRFYIRIIDVKPPRMRLKGVEHAKCDVRNYEEVKTVLKGLDLVIHTAVIQIPRINEEKQLGYYVNVIGTQNVCKVVDVSRSIRGLLLTGSWHTVGEREIAGYIDEAFGYRPDKVEDRARLYALSKILQEGVVRFYDEMSDKIFGIIRMGTVLGEGMPEKTAASIFIERGLRGLPITPYKHSMYRPMLYVDIRDICMAFESFTSKILNGEVAIGNNSLQHTVNVVHPEPVTIIELAEIVRATITELTDGKTSPQIEVVDKGLPSLFSQDDKNKFKVDINNAIELLGLKRFISPKESIGYIIRRKLSINVG